MRLGSFQTACLGRIHGLQIEKLEGTKNQKVCKLFKVSYENSEEIHVEHDFGMMVVVATLVAYFARINAEKNTGKYA